MSVYGVGVYGTGIYGATESLPPPEPPYIHHVTTARLGESGIVLGETDEYGVTWGWQAGTDAWSPGPEPRDISGSRGSAHGSWSATRFYGNRVQELSVTVQAPSHDALHHAAQRWMTAIGIRPFEFVVDEPYFGKRGAMMRRDGRPTWTEMFPGGRRAGGVAMATASLVANDPLIYGNVEQAASTGFPSSTGGLQWPAQWPARWDAVVESGLLRMTNTGSEPAPILWRIEGPVIDPTVTNVDTQERFRLAMEIPADEWVSIDSATGRVLAMGQPQASRRAQWSGKWLELPPGESTFAFSGAEGGVGTRLFATWRDAWI